VSGPPERHTFLFADLAGFTALTEAHGDEAAADAALAFCVDIRNVLAAYAATEVKTMGDAMMIVCSDASAALRLACFIVDDLGRRHAALGVRAGLHTGPAIHRQDDWFGATVNIAARIAAQAASGEIVLSEATRIAARPEHDGLVLRSRGLLNLRNVSEPVPAWTVQLRAAAPMLRDPVCHMQLEPRRVSERLVHEGQTYVFCSAACLDTFRAAPAVYSQRDDAPFAADPDAP
jgi:adenylate cyclase